MLSDRLAHTEAKRSNAIESSDDFSPLLPRSDRLCWQKSGSEAFKVSFRPAIVETGGIRAILSCVVMLQQKLSWRSLRSSTIAQSTTFEAKKHQTNACTAKCLALSFDLARHPEDLARKVPRKHLPKPLQHLESVCKHDSTSKPAAKMPKDPSPSGSLHLLPDPRCLWQPHHLLQEVLFNPGACVCRVGQIKSVGSGQRVAISVSQPVRCHHSAQRAGIAACCRKMLEGVGVGVRG